MIKNVSSLKENHPFAQYIHILGRGKTGTRSLTAQEAYQAMQMILKEEVEEAQLGAFLMLLRVKEESPEELAGFVKACHQQIDAPAIPVDINWPSYAGKKNQNPWSLLAAKLLAKQGIKILLHGAPGTQDGRFYTEASATGLQIASVSTWQEAKQHLETDNICYMSVQNMSPIFYELLFYRRLMGLRSAMHSIARLLNPLNAPISLQGVFHPAYGPSHQQASILLQQPYAAAFKGEGGEAEIRPDANSKIYFKAEQRHGEERWQRQLDTRAQKQQSLSLEHMNSVWNKECQDDYGEAAVISTTALALWLKGMCQNQAQAFEQAKLLWAKR